RQTVPCLAEIRRKVREDLALTSGQLRLIAHHRHVTDRALVLHVSGGGGMVEYFTPDTGHPVRIARRIGHHARSPVHADRNVLARWRGDPVVTGDAALGRLEMRSVVCAETLHWLDDLRRLRTE